MSLDRRERRAADQRARAVEHHDLQLGSGALQQRRGGAPGLRGDGVAQRRAAARAPARRPGRRYWPPGSAPRPFWHCSRHVSAKAARTEKSTSPRLECRSSRPCASLVIFATPPAMVTRGTGMGFQIFQHAADKIAHFDERHLGQPCKARTAFSEVLPVEPAICAMPLARATSMPRWIEWIQAEQENGTTMPVVPRIDRPPMMPSRPFKVRCARALAVGDGDFHHHVAGACGAVLRALRWRRGSSAVAPG